MKETARVLQEIFGRDSLIGRVGGDEFALLLYTPTTRGQLEMDLQRLQEQIHRLQRGAGTLSCSIGALPIASGGIAAEQLYQEADALLYTAKVQGRGRYVIGAPAAASTAAAQ